MNAQTQDRQVEQLLTNARERASKGDVRFTQFYLEQTREYAEGLGVPLLDEVILREIVQTAYRNGIEAWLGEARSYASHGNVSFTQVFLKGARKYAGEGEVPLPEATLQEIEQTACRKGVEVQLGEARRCASRGDIPSTQFFSERAREYAGIIGLDITSRLQGIEGAIRKQTASSDLREDLNLGATCQRNPKD